MDLENKIFKLITEFEDTSKVAEFLHNSFNRGSKFDSPAYIGFSFHKDAFHNVKLLNSLRLVIPKILNMTSHKGNLSIEFYDGSKKDFHGWNTENIIKFLVTQKLLNKWGVK